MIKRIKYGCFALLFISTLTLSSVVAILASSSGGLDNSFYLTYTPARAGKTMITGTEFNSLLTTTIPEIVFRTADVLVFDYYNDDYLTKIEEATSCHSVAEDGSDDILMYVIDSSTCSIYVLSDYNILANEDCSNMFKGVRFRGAFDFIFNNFNTVNTRNMSSMFGASGAKNLDLSNFNTSNVTTMNSMFSHCNIYLKSLNVSSFNTSNVTDMYQMFFYCDAITSLDISSFDTLKVTNMYGMFNSCNNLTTIYAGDCWSTENVTSSTNMFYDCTSLVGGNGTAFNSSYTDATYARIDTADTPGYFTAKT